METEEALVVLHVSVDDWPDDMDEGEAVSEHVGAGDDVESPFFASTESIAMLGRVS